MLSLILLGSPSALASGPCSTDNHTTHAMVFSSEDFEILAIPDPVKIEVGTEFGLNIYLCGTEDIEISKVDARMPKHGHGMNYAPKLEAGSKAHVSAKPLLFHMPGLWEIAINVKSQSGNQTLTNEIQILP